MSTTRRLALACTALLALALLPSAASATVAMNDSVELDQVLAGDIPASTCPCFCTYEGFAATLTAPEDMTLDYIYLHYGAFVDVDVKVDFYLYDGDEPGTEFGGGASGVFGTVSMTGSDVLEIDVAGAGVTPPAVSAGDVFTVGVVYGYGDGEGADDVVPNGGHGPSYDDNGEAVAGTNWVLGFDADGCGDAGDAMTWSLTSAIGLAADWVIRVSDEQVDWTQPMGDDDDVADDDDVVDDDDVADDDDAVADDDDSAGDDDDDDDDGCDCSSSVADADQAGLLALVLLAPLALLRRR